MSHESTISDFTIKPLKNFFYVINKFLIYSTFFLFRPQKDFKICLGPFFTFFLFLLQKDIHTFNRLLFEAFLCLFDNFYLPFIQKILFFNFLHQNFLSQLEEISISSIIYLGILFSLMTYLHPPKSTWG